MAFKTQKVEPTGVVYANPADPDMTIRVKNTSTKKILGGQQVANIVTEVIGNNVIVLSLGSSSVTEPVSVRVRVSGSVNAISQKKELMKIVLASCTKWMEEDVLVGFNPASPPPDSV